MAQLYDIVIAGGGMVGNAFALACARSAYLTNRRVLLLEATKRFRLPEAKTPRFSNRVSAINPASCELFKKLSALERLEKLGRMKNVSRLEVWDACSKSYISFAKAPADAALAYIIENNTIIASLTDELDRTDVESRYETSVKDIEHPSKSDDLVSLELSDGTSVRTKLLVGADGFNSLVRASMKTQVTAWNYDQKAVVATLKLGSFDPRFVGNDIAWQRFTPNGPVAMLPLSNDESSLVWTTTPSEADRLVAAEPDEFIEELNAQFETNENQNEVVDGLLGLCEALRSRLIGIESEAKLHAPTVVAVQEKSRACFPLGLQHVHDYARPRVALIGDAAHRIHPLAGLGVNLGFADAVSLVKTLENAVEIGKDIGMLSDLNKYEHERQLHVAPVMVGIDWLNRLYSTDFSGAVLLRSLGLSAVNQIEPLKRVIMDSAGSSSIRLPNILKLFGFI